VNENHWLTESQFVDAVAVAMITPGPVVITFGFIGFLIAGFPGAIHLRSVSDRMCQVVRVSAIPSSGGSKQKTRAFINRHGRNCYRPV